MNSGLKAENTDNPKTRGSQRNFSDNIVGSRIIEALGPRSRKWLAEKAGISDSTVSDYIAKGIAKADAAVAIAEALDISLDWLMRGKAGSGAGGDLRTVEDADWVIVPEFDLRELTDTSKGEIVSETPFRRDWLYNSLNHVSELWVARMPADYEGAGLYEGDRVFVRDVALGEATDRALYIVRIEGTLTVARLNALAETGILGERLGETMISFRHFGRGEGKAVPVARILGVPLMRI